MNAATESRPVVTARGLRKAYKHQVALNGADFTIPAGRIVGLIGPNGAGKTTALKAILGLIPFEGQLEVLGRDPRTQRDALMNDVCRSEEHTPEPQSPKRTSSADYRLDKKYEKPHQET